MEQEGFLTNIRQHSRSPPRSRTARRTPRLPTPSQARRQPTQRSLQKHDGPWQTGVKETGRVQQAEEVHRVREVELQGLAVTPIERAVLHVKIFELNLVRHLHASEVHVTSSLFPTYPFLPRTCPLTQKNTPGGIDVYYTDSNLHT